MLTPTLRRDVQLWSPAPLATDPLLRISWSRAAAALGRSKWLMAIVMGLGLAAGLAVTRLAAPVYVAQAKLWIANDRSHGESQGAAPIRAADVMRQTAWPELLTSFAVLDTVVRKTTLNVIVPKSVDAPLFAGFQTGPDFTTGSYELRVDKSGWQYQLVDSHGKAVQSGMLGDSIGQALGMRWKPSGSALTPGRVVKFTVLTARDAAQRLRRNLAIDFDAQSGLLGVTLTGSDPGRTAALLGTIVDEFRSLAAQLKSHNASEVTKVLKQQLDFEERELHAAESQLEDFRVQQATIAGAAGSDSADSHNALFDNYLRRELERDSLRREREAVERTVSAIRSGSIEPTALWLLPAVRAVAPPELRTTLATLDSTKARLRGATDHYTDDHTIVQRLRGQIADLESSRIPSAVDGVIGELSRREREADAQTTTLAQRLRTTPAQNTREAQLRRNLEAHTTLYATLRHRYDEAMLAQTGETPDITVLDPVVAPERPSSDRMPFIILFALMLSAGIAITLAIARDRLDSRFRYPEQAVDELGLEVLGTVPSLQRRALQNRDQAAQVTEAFRTMRMTVTNVLASERPLTLAVSSSAPGDGKSLIAANLALSFAAAGWETVLVDGDLRRGNLHARFDVDVSPGLVDWLASDASLDDTLRATTEGLTIIPRGTFSLAAPELLLGERIKELVELLRERFAAIIVDSPPLGAGVDPLALGAAAGNLLLVLRSGKTDRRMAQAHLRVLGRLPIRVIGTVLNGVPDTGAYQYYGYMDSDLRNRAPELSEAARQTADFAQRSGLTL